MAICRNFDLDNEKFDEEIRAGTECPFVQQDEPMVEALQEVVGDREFWSMKPALLQGDIGTVAVRRALDRMIEKERAASDHSCQPAPTFG